MHAPTVDPAFLDTAVSAAREAGRLALSMRRGLPPARLKGEKDLVTEADIACDRLIRTRLQEAFPAHDLLTEEEGALARGGEYCWIVDPIDGTINYARGFPLWGVSIALARAGVPVCGTVYLPVTDELFTATAGGGAFLNGTPVRASDVGDPAGAVVSHGDFNVGGDPAARERLNGANARILAALTPMVQRLKCLGSAVVEGTGVACGRLDAYWMDSFKPWDVAVTTLLVAEAGGRVTDLRGAPWTLESPDVLFSNGILHDALLERIRSVLEAGPR